MAEEYKKEPMDYPISYASIEKLINKFMDLSLPDEQRKEYLNKAGSIWKELEKIRNERKTKGEKPLTPEDLKKMLKSKKISEPHRTQIEILLAIWKSIKTKKNLPQPIKEKLENELRKKELDK